MPLVDNPASMRTEIRSSFPLSAGRMDHQYQPKVHNKTTAMRRKSFFTTQVSRKNRQGGSHPRPHPRSFPHRGKEALLHKNKGGFPSPVGEGLGVGDQFPISRIPFSAGNPISL